MNEEATERVEEGVTRREGSEPNPGTVLEPEVRSAIEEVGELKAELEREKKKRRRLKEKANAGVGTSRGIETMFRSSYRLHVDLSGLADNKANIMISINGIIISILIASIAPRLSDSPSLLLPTAVLLVGCLVSMVYAVLSARPRVSSHVVSLDDIREGRSNILFFGNFVTLSEADFVQGMKELMEDTEEVYMNMTRDLHSLGSVLDRKFRLLRISYNVFMTGLVAGVLLFLAVIGTTLGTGPL